MQKYVETHIIIKHKYLQNTATSQQDKVAHKNRSYHDKYLQNTATSQQYKVAHKNRIYHDKVAAQYYRYTKQHH